MEDTPLGGANHASLREVIDILQELYPPHTALSWDRVGLVTGDLQQRISRIHFAVDPTAAVIDEARDLGADLLVTHHPLLLRGVHSVATTSAKGRAVTALIVADVALYTAHTNADVAKPGVCDALARACGLRDLDTLTLEEGQELGRVGCLPPGTTLGDFARTVLRALPPAPVGIRVSGPQQAPVHRVAVLGGAGDSLFEAVRACGADVYLTADLRHHPALEAREEAQDGPPYLIDAGHWASEHVWLADAAARVEQVLRARGVELELFVSTLCTDPWNAVLTAGQDWVPMAHPAPGAKQSTQQEAAR